MAGFGKQCFVGYGYGRKVQINHSGFGQQIYMSSSHNIGEEIHVDHNGFGDQVWVSGCFPKYAKVKMVSGELLPISDVKANDEIVAYCVKSGIWQSVKVLETHTHLVFDMYFFNESIEVTSSQPLLVLKCTKRGELAKPEWRYSIDLQIGDYIMGSNGKPIEIKSKRSMFYEKPIETLHLSTENALSFIVEGCVVRANNAKDLVVRLTQSA